MELSDGLEVSERPELGESLGSRGLATRLRREVAEENEDAVVVPQPPEVAAVEPELANRVAVHIRHPAIVAE